MQQQQKDKCCRIKPADIERVMTVAGRLFARHGYEGVGIRQIADESGVTMPSIFYHFGSKASLYEEVLEHKYQATIDMVSKAIKSLREPRERLEFLIGSFFDQLFRDRTFLLLVHRDIGDVVARKPRPAFLEEYSYTFAAFCTVLDAVMGRPIERRVAFSLVSLILGFCELSALMSETDLRTQDEEAWYAEQRAELIETGKRICSL
ncbi:MAG: TetR/AcrR family transcriptional regulator [Pseudomonadota bacterium]|nr:TetR/AcrR family transcriptional regulator [Pseudomonadota bacterium]